MVCFVTAPPPKMMVGTILSFYQSIVVQFFTLFLGGRLQDLTCLKFSALLDTCPDLIQDMNPDISILAPGLVCMWIASVTEHPQPACQRSPLRRNNVSGYIFDQELYKRRSRNFYDWNECTHFSKPSLKSSIHYKILYYFVAVSIVCKHLKMIWRFSEL